MARVTATQAVRPHAVEAWPPPSLSWRHWPVAAFIDPVTHGLEIAIGIPGNPDGIDMLLPAGAYDPVTRQGWSDRTEPS